MSVVVVALGCFYAVAGVITLAALRRDRVLRAMLKALGSDGGAKEIVRDVLLGVGAALTSIGGLALVVGSRFTIPLMLANVATQAVWLVFAFFRFPPEDEEDARGRRRTVNAFVVYLAATVFVVWLQRGGYARFAADAGYDLALAALAGCAALWLVYDWRAAGAFSKVAPNADGAESAPPNFPAPTRIRLEPQVGAWPLWDDDTDRNVDPHSLELPAELLARIVEFENEVIDSLDVDHPDGMTIVDRTAVARLSRRATELARELAVVYGEHNVAWRLPGE